MLTDYAGMVTSEWSGVTHALRDGWRHYRQPIISLCGREMTSTRSNMNSPVEVTCRTCLAIHERNSR